MRRFHTLALTSTALAALVVATGWAQLAPSQPAPAPADDYYDIGAFHYAASTKSTAAQLWFDRGLAMCFGFNHEEAIRCFKRALGEDPSLAMALWGIAYALGPNINNMLIAPEPMAQAALSIHLAEVVSPHASPLERELIAALAKRYAMPVPALDAREPLNQAYADELREVHKRHPDDPLATALFAEALMNLQPWKNWQPDGTPAQHTDELLAVLENGLARWPDHPLLCHLYIHAIEASPAPEKALPVANRLRTLAPGLGHLVHMPSHIDVLVGDYDEVIATNNAAIGVDREFVRQQGAMNFFTLYRVHNYHFLTYGAMFDGQSGLALRAAREMVKQIPEPMLRAQTDFLDAFIPTPLHVLIRFGRWEEILAEPEPADYLPMTRSIRHYARGLAYAATSRVSEAEAEQALFNEARQKVPETSYLFQNPSTSILGVAEAMLAGEIAYRQGDHAAAFNHLREAVRRDDALNYDEPWGWMQPARHALGALLLEQNQPVEAESVFRADLKRHPHNPWALHGLAECLAKQNRADEAARFEAEYQAAIDDADVSINRSCFCRLSAAD